MTITINRDSHIKSMDSRIFEIVERKGDGHPDTICDNLVNVCAKELSKAYLKDYGQPQHYNLDKAFLIAGQTQPKIGQHNDIIEPMNILIGDRATKLKAKDGVQELIEDTATKYMVDNFRHIDENNFGILSVAQEGSKHLRTVFDNKLRIGANDTSATVGYAPLSRTENLVHSIENVIRTLRQREKALGEDVKIMAVRNNGKVDITLAVAMVAKELSSIEEYKQVKNWTQGMVIETLREWGEAHVVVNALDNYKTGEVYITETGLSAEGADSGQVGRGNNPVGVIPLCRPASAEAEAGKNADSHVGKIYNRLAFHIANEIYNKTGYENYVWMVSRIGQLVNDPLYVNVELADGTTATNSVIYDAERIVKDSVLNWKSYMFF